MARHGIYQKLERFLIKSFVYICEGLVLVHRHFMKPRNVSNNFIKIVKIAKSDILKLIDIEQNDTIWNHFIQILSKNYKTSGEIQNNCIKVWKQGNNIGALYPIYTFELNSENQLIKVSSRLNPVGKVLFLMLPVSFSFLFYNNIFGNFEYKKSLISIGIILVFLSVYILISFKFYRFEKKEQLKDFYTTLNKNKNYC